MAVQVPKFGRVAAFLVVTQFNALKRELNSLLSSPKAHADITSKASSVDPEAPTATANIVTAADGAGTPAGTIALANDILTKYFTHLADSVAHKIADPPPALVACTDLTTAIALLNAIKADYNTHRASTTYHYAADSTNSVATADATDQASADTLGNDIKAKFNAHIQLALATPSITLG